MGDVDRREKPVGILYGGGGGTSSIYIGNNGSPFTTLLLECVIIFTWISSWVVGGLHIYVIGIFECALGY